MIAKLLPVVLALVGSGAGIGTGLFLRPPPAAVEAKSDDASSSKEEHEDTHADDHAKEKDDHGSTDDHSGKDDHGEKSDGPEYVEMSNQFVIPVVSDENLSSLMILSLSLEVAAGQQEKVFSYEPKLRDSFMQVMFDHANTGGFSGAFTDASTLGSLRTALREVAQRDVGVKNVMDVLILEIARQDY